MVSGIWSSSGVTGGTSPHRDRASSTRACARDSGSRQRRRSTGAASRATPGAKAVGRAAGVRSTTALLRPRSAGLIGNGSRIVGPAVWNPSSDTWEALVAQLSDIQPAGDHMMAAQFKTASERVQVEIRATEAEIGRRSAGSALAGSPTSPIRCARSGRSRASTGAARTDRRAAEHVHVGAGVSIQAT